MGSSPNRKWPTVRSRGLVWQGVWGLIFEVQCGQKARGTSTVQRQGAEGQPENGDVVCLGKGQNRRTAGAGWAEPAEALCSLDALGTWSAFASALAVPSAVTLMPPP